jgi:hypothetical protein
MPRFAVCFVAALLVVVLLLTHSASAVIVQMPVTPASVREKDSKFTIKSELRKDGMVHFTITYRLARPQYLVAHFELREGTTTLAQTDTPAYVREGEATFYVAVSAKQLADSKFELSEHAFQDSGGRAIALPGGTIYQLNLPAFAKDAAAADPE